MIIISKEQTVDSCVRITIPIKQKSINVKEVNSIVIALRNPLRDELIYPVLLGFDSPNQRLFLQVAVRQLEKTPNEIRSLIRRAVDGHQNHLDVLNIMVEEPPA